MPGAGVGFEGIAGHRRVLRVLASQVESDHVPHAYLFVGEPQLGKTTVARRLAQLLLPDVPLSRNPDYWEDDRRTTIKIDEIRLLPNKEPEAHSQTLQAFLALKPSTGRRRVAVIANVGRMKDETQGILLKTLEEPQPGRVLILTAPSVSPFVVLPTIVSRCQRVAFHAVPDGEVAQVLVDGGVSAETADELAAAARGRPGWALQAAADTQFAARREQWREVFRSVLGAPRDVPLQVAAALDREHMAWRGTEEPDAPDPLLEALETWQLDIRDRMRHDAHPATWARLLELSYDAIGYHEQYVSPRLNLECFLLRCRRAS